MSLSKETLESSIERARVLWKYLGPFKKGRGINPWYARAILLMAYKPFVEELNDIQSSEPKTNVTKSGYGESPYDQFEQRWCVSLQGQCDLRELPKWKTAPVEAIRISWSDRNREDLERFQGIFGNKICLIDFLQPIAEIVKQIKEIHSTVEDDSVLHGSKASGEQMSFIWGPPSKTEGDQTENEDTQKIRRTFNETDFDIIGLFSLDFSPQEIFNLLTKQRRCESDRTGLFKRLNDVLRPFIDKDKLGHEFWDSHPSKRAVRPRKKRPSNK